MSGRETVVRCVHCLVPFTVEVRPGRPRVCDACRHKQYIKKLESRRRIRSSVPPLRRERTQPARYLFRQDFLDALPELRAELARQTADGFSPFYVPTREESALELPLSTLKRPTARNA